MSSGVTESNFLYNALLLAWGSACPRKMEMYSNMMKVVVEDNQLDLIYSKFNDEELGSVAQTLNSYKEWIEPDITAMYPYYIQCLQGWEKETDRRFLLS